MLYSVACLPERNAWRTSPEPCRACSRPWHRGGALERIEVVSGGSGARINLESLPPAQRNEVLRLARLSVTRFAFRAVRDLGFLPNDIGELGAELAKVELKGGERVDRVAILLSFRRLDLAHRQQYTETFLYMVREGKLDGPGERFSSAENEGAALLRRFGFDSLGHDVAGSTNE